jgi:hypothetical protein
MQKETSPTLNILPKEVITQNFLTPLRAVGMDTDSSSIKATSNEEAALAKQVGRPE